jgi:hypothetical protein
MILIFIIFISCDCKKHSRNKHKSKKTEIEGKYYRFITHYGSDSKIIVCLEGYKYIVNYYSTVQMYKEGNSSNNYIPQPIKCNSFDSDRGFK